MQQDIKEIENVWSNNTYIDKHRWNYLYKDNDKVIDYDLDIVKKLIDNNEILLDTCLKGLKLKEILFNKNLISLSKLFENVEYYYFVKKLSKKLDITVFEFPSSDDITSFSLEERKKLDSKIGYILFNPSSIDYPYLVNEIKEYRNYNYSLYRLYPKEYKELIPVFERLSFKEKKDGLAELFLILEHDKLLHDSFDGFEIPRRILKY